MFRTIFTTLRALLNRVSVQLNCASDMTPRHLYFWLYSWLQHQKQGNLMLSFTNQSIQTNNKFWASWVNLNAFTTFSSCFLTDDVPNFRISDSGWPEENVTYDCKSCCCFKLNFYPWHQTKISPWMFNLLKMPIYSPTEKAPASRVRAPAPPPSRGWNRRWGLHDWR